jgi:hypothetical protein
VVLLAWWFIEMVFVDVQCFTGMSAQGYPNPNVFNVSSKIRKKTPTTTGQFNDNTRTK